MTQELSRYVFEQADDDGNAAFVGIRYASRLGDELTNWAIFEPHDVEDPRTEELSDDDPDLLAVLEDYGLVLAGDP